MSSFSLPIESKQTRVMMTKKMLERHDVGNDGILMKMSIEQH